MRARHVVAIAFGLALGGIASGVALWWAGVEPSALFSRAGGRPVTTILGMHRLDPELGYELLPGAVLRHQTSEFDVEYQIEPDGGRRVPGGDPDGPRIDIYGDSWTFGHGVADDETYAAELQRRRPESRVRNRGVMGYGTVHAMLALERDLERDGAPDVVVYGFNPIHVMRNHLRDGHLRNVAGGRTPAYDVVRGRLVPLGLVGPEAAIESGTLGLAHAERVRTRLFVREMARLARRAGARFVLVLLDGPDRISGWDERSQELEEALGKHLVEVHDLTRTPDEAPASEHYFEDDHPTAPWHAKTGAAIDQALRAAPHGGDTVRP